MIYTIFEHVKNFVLYGGTDQKSYLSVRGKLEASNRISSLVFSCIAAVLIGVMLLLSFHQEGLSSSKPVYLAGLLFSLLFIAISVASWKWPLLSYVAVYMAVSVFLIYGIAIATLTRPNDQTVTFMVLLIFVPLIFVDRPIRIRPALYGLAACLIVCERIGDIAAVLFHFFLQGKLSHTGLRHQKDTAKQRNAGYSRQNRQ